MSEISKTATSDLVVAKISDKLRPVLNIAEEEYLHVCQGFGSDFCLECPYADLIPEDCPMEELGKGAQEIACSICPLVCPCNRSVDYDKVLKDLMRFEINRVQS